MKKLFALIMITIVSLALFVQPAPADAQVIYTRKCCDGYGVVRCVLDNWTPVGNSCLCYQQGWGFAC